MKNKKKRNRNTDMNMNENKEKNLVMNKNMNMFIEYLNKNGIETKTIKTETENEVITFVSHYFDCEEKRYKIGTIRCLFAEQKFQIIKKLISIKKISESENSKQIKHLYWYYCRFENWVGGIQSFINKNAIYVSLTIPLSPLKIDPSIMVASYLVFIENIIENGYKIGRCENEQLEVGYCEDE